jgi:hypothetical protein
MRRTTLPAVGLLGTGTLAILLWVAGLAWVTTDFIEVTIFGSTDRWTGPFGLSLSWLERLPEIGAVLGLVALFAAAVALRPRPAPRWLAAAITAILALGTAFLAAWLIDPPATSSSAASVSWPAYATTSALAAATACGILLTALSSARHASA